MPSQEWPLAYDSLTDTAVNTYCASATIRCGYDTGLKVPGHYNAIALKDFSGVIPGGATIDEARFVIGNPAMVGSPGSYDWRVCAAHHDYYTWDDDPCPGLSGSDGVNFDDSKLARHDPGPNAYQYWVATEAVKHAIADHSSVFSCRIEGVGLPAEDHYYIWPSLETEGASPPKLYIAWSVAAGNIKEVAGVAWADVKEVSGVAQANIKEVAGVSAS